MGVKTEQLEAAFAAQPDQPVIHPVFDWDTHPDCWQVTWREPIDRGTPRTRLIAWTFREAAGIPSPAWYHDMGVCSTEERADAAAADIIRRQGGRCAVYSKTIDVVLPVEPIHPLTLKEPEVAEDVRERSSEIITRRALRELIEIQTSTVKGG